jgi:uncharacterized protein YjbI with pentapeptide repeats
MREISREELDLILEKHKKWLNNEDGGERADLRETDLRETDLRWANLSEANLSEANLSEANLSETDLRETDLRWANLRWANLSGANLRWANLSEADLSEANLSRADLRWANLDYSVMFFGCRDLDHHIDDKLAIQRLYHTLRNVKFSKNVSQELKDKLLTPEILEIANKFHRVDECGEIEV